MTAGPNRNNKISPAPAPVRVIIPVRYLCNIVGKLNPLMRPNNFIESHVPAVHVTSGCTIFVNLFGSLAPNTKASSVVNKRNAVVRGVTMVDAAGTSEATVAVMALATFSTRISIVNLSENDEFSGGAPVSIDVSASSSVDISLLFDISSRGRTVSGNSSFEDERRSRIAKTEIAVETSVK
jgi:hypothetical protein